MWKDGRCSGERFKQPQTNFNQYLSRRVIKTEGTSYASCLLLRSNKYLNYFFLPKVSETFHCFMPQYLTSPIPHFPLLSLQLLVSVPRGLFSPTPFSDSVTCLCPLFLPLPVALSRCQLFPCPVRLIKAVQQLARPFKCVAMCVCMQLHSLQGGNAPRELSDCSTETRLTF